MRVPLYRSMAVFAAIICVAIVSYWLNTHIGQAPEATIVPLVTIFLGAIVAIGIIRQPFFGILVIISTIPIIGILPDNAFLILGALTVGSYSASILMKKRQQVFHSLTPVHLLAILFVAWIFVSNPTAALPSGDRNWIFTFMELLVLVWLMSELLIDRARHELLMWAFVGFSIIAAITIINQVAAGVPQANLGDLTSGANSAGRYFVISIVFLMYLKNRINRSFLPVIFIGIVILLVGLWFSASRSMFLVLGFVFLLFILQTITSKSNINRARQVLTLGILIATVLIIGVQVGGLNFLNTSIIQTLVDNGDTVGTRTRLWEAGLRMWSDFPISGVGIGKFQDNLPFYGKDLLRTQYLDVGPHNMYIAVLAETGLVGLVLFAAIIIMSLYVFWKATKLGSQEQSALAWAWLLAFIVMLLGGITKHDQYDKFLWATIGSTAYFHRLISNTPNALKLS